MFFHNWRPVPHSFAQGNVVVATDDSPTGPFHIETLDLQTSHHPTEIGDYNVFVDALSPDFLRSAGRRAEFLGRGEAVTMFLEKNRYYVLWGRNCCFCPEGSNMYVKSATSPLEPYRENRPFDIRADKRINVQSTFVASLPTARRTRHFYLGDRWRSAPGCRCMKGHNPQYWGEPLRFGPDGGI